MTHKQLVNSTIVFYLPVLTKVMLWQQPGKLTIVGHFLNKLQACCHWQDGDKSGKKRFGFSLFSFQPPIIWLNCVSCSVAREHCLQPQTFPGMWLNAIRNESSTDRVSSLKSNNKKSTVIKTTNFNEETELHFPS